MARRPTMTDEWNETETLQTYLRELHLPTFRASFEGVARQAQQGGLSYERFLLELARREVQERRNGRIARLLRQSQLPQEKSWPALDLKRLPPRLFRFWVTCRGETGLLFPFPVGR